jgi:hypothetical protein
MTITCFIRYQIDPFQRAAFKEYAHNWGRIIPRCGGTWWLLSAARRQQRRGLGPDRIRQPGRLRTLPRTPEDRPRVARELRDGTGQAADPREERSFVEVVEGTFGIPAAA